MAGSKDKIKILIVDDEPTILQTLKRVLEKEGYEIVTFDRPFEALSYLKSDGCRLIITDLKMPGMDGIQLLSQAKEICPETPVVLMTAFATIDTAVSAIQLGAFDYIKKPFNIDKIYEVVSRALDFSKS